MPNLTPNQMPNDVAYRIAADLASRNQVVNWTTAFQPSGWGNVTVHVTNHYALVMEPQIVAIETTTVLTINVFGEGAARKMSFGDVKILSKGAPISLIAPAHMS